MMKMSNVSSVVVNWLDGGNRFYYETIPSSLAANDDRLTLRFSIREIDGADDDLEVVVQRDEKGEHHFKTDYYENPLEELPVKTFNSDGETILFYDGQHGTAYFHLRGK